MTTNITFDQLGSELGLRDELLASLQLLSFTHPTPIQATALPILATGADLVGRAQTGSGKTVTFGLALLQGIEPATHAPQALVLCPTRELAEQVAGELRNLARRMPNTRVLVCCGGRPIRTQAEALMGPAQVVVGTPGRVLDLIKRRTLKLRGITTLVLDEADRMLDMGFIDEVKDIIDHAPRDRQTLLFSATFPDEVQALSAQFQYQPETVHIESTLAQTHLNQAVVLCAPAERKRMVVKLLVAHKPSSALVFCETRKDCDEMADFLVDQGAHALPLHGEYEQRERDELLTRFLHGSTAILVATNIAARGLDIPALPLVIVSELGGEVESHTHRIGRTARAGEDGLAISIVAGAKEEARLAAIEEHLGTTIDRIDPPPVAGRLDFMQAPNQTLILLAGKKDKIRKGDILGALIKDGGLEPSAIGRIDIFHNKCAIAIDKRCAQQALDYVRRSRIKKKKVRGLLLD